MAPDRTPPPDAAAWLTYTLLRHTADGLRAGIAPLLAARGITPTQLEVLDVLRRTGPLCQRDIGGRLASSGGNISVVVDNLERRRLVRRERGTGDNRLVTVHLSARGRETIETLRPGIETALDATLSVLTPAELRMLRELCDRLRENNQ